ncbi:hypothetical protein ZWY2020_043307 [Hordeum vulgare]|nr:hypothetical protein ZWY2020_043307 [Hordeum vulgare]
METKLAHASSSSHRRHVHQATEPLFHPCRGLASTSHPGQVTTVSRMCCCRAPLRLAASTEPPGCSSASAMGRRRQPPQSSRRRDKPLQSSHHRDPPMLLSCSTTCHHPPASDATPTAAVVARLHLTSPRRACPITVRPLRAGFALGSPRPAPLSAVRV